MAEGNLRYTRWVLRQSKHRLFLFFCGYWLAIQFATSAAATVGFVLYTHKPFHFPLAVIPAGVLSVLSAALWASIMTPVSRQAAKRRLARSEV
jgi:hypothetical protein